MVCAQIRVGVRLDTSIRARCLIAGRVAFGARTPVAATTWSRLLRSNLRLHAQGQRRALLIRTPVTQWKCLQDTCQLCASPARPPASIYAEPTRSQICIYVCVYSRVRGSVIKRNNERQRAGGARKKQSGFVGRCQSERGVWQQREREVLARRKYSNVKSKARVCYGEIGKRELEDYTRMEG